MTAFSKPEVASMEVNRAQLQRGLSLAEFMNTYGTETRVHRALYRARWRQTTLESGALFEHSRLPLRSWLLALQVLTSTKTHLVALELRQHLGVNWKTAWRLRQRVIHATTVRGGTTDRGAPGKHPFVIAVETDSELEHQRYAVLEPVHAV